ncbi:MAG: hypothetical protein ACI33P_12310 [Lysinibacillus sp.]
MTCKYTMGKLIGFIGSFFHPADDGFSAKINGRTYLLQELTFYYRQLEEGTIAKLDIRELCKSVERHIEQEGIDDASELLDYFRSRKFTAERNYGVLKEKLLLVRPELFGHRW